MTFERRTEPDALARKRERVALGVILLVAAALRLWHLDFGLPALNDPDEPVFIMTALDMLREGRLNPGWFGHPGTLLFYLLALVIAGVAVCGIALGRWAGSDGFVAAVFADPAIVVLPMRMLSAACGVASVWMTWRIGRHVRGPSTGLAAAALLAVNALHVELSQVIRTDMLATLLMSWSLLHALEVARTGRRRDHIWAGVAAGLAAATKWPALLVLIAPALAGLWRARAERRALRLVPVAPLVALATLLLVSPYLALDWRTVVHDLLGEARPVHPGATGHGLAGNLVWYLRHPLLESFGGAALFFLAVGTITAARCRAGALVLLPTLALMLVALSTQSLVWARWMVPLLPIIAVLIAVGVARVVSLGASDLIRRWAAISAMALLVVFMTSVTLERQARRNDDPRQAATAWVRQHVPPGRTILIEHAAFDLLPYRGRLLFPLGSAGCVDIRAVLASRPSHRRVARLRDQRPVVDLGHVAPERLRSCRADLVVLANYSRYRQEGVRFPRELKTYQQVTTDFHRIATFRGSGSGIEGSKVEIYAPNAKRYWQQLHR